MSNNDKIKNKEDIRETEKKFLCPKKNFFTWDYQKRNIDFMSEFDDDTAQRFITNIRAVAKEFEEGENADIYLYINSCGGVVTSLLAMVDAMNLVPNDFVTVGIGQCASCGAVLLSCGTKGKRYITENARVLIHQVSSGMWGKNSEIQADAKEMDRLNKLLIGMLAKNCGKSVEELEKLTLGGDLILDAQSAVEFGIVDAVLTKDVIDRLNREDAPELFAPDGSDNGKKEDDEEDVLETKTKTKTSTNYDTTSLNLEFKGMKEDDEYYYVKGIASTPDIDRVDDIVDPDCLIKSVERIGLPAFVHQHNLSDMPLGICERVYKDGNCTMVDLKMPKDADSKKIRDRIKMGAYGGLSIGYVAKDYNYDAEGYRVIKDLDWYEVSLVTVPANPNAKILEVKKQEITKNQKCDIINNIKTIRDVENLLCELGISKKEAGYIIKTVKSGEGEPKPEEHTEGGEGEPKPNEVPPEENNNVNVEALKGILETLKTYGTKK